MIRPIRTTADHEAAIAEIERLAIRDPAPGSKDADRLEILATLAEVYEKVHFPIDKPTPAEAIEFRMEQLGLKPKDLVPYIGSRSRVSEVLSGKRPLTLRMIRTLSERLDIPSGVLLQEPPKVLPPNVDIDWRKFPIAVMVARKWIITSLDQVLGREEELMRSFLARVKGADLVSVLYRKTKFAVRTARKMDQYALVAWCARVLGLAQDQVVEKYTAGTVNAEFMQNVARCSWSENGPLLAQEFLANHGIHLVVEPHLPRTYLDGSACLMAKSGAPVIGMTIRHDRIDNFWFVLLHELAHIRKHVDIDGEHALSFFDDLDVEPGDAKEIEADNLASEALIPQHIWENVVASPMTPGAIAKLAAELTIHSAIIAGRYRHESKNYKRFSKMVGRNGVRKLFKEVSWQQ